MKREDISKIVDGIGEELIEEVSAQREREFFETRTKKRHAARRVLKIALPIAACIAVIAAIPGIISAVSGNGNSTLSAKFGKVPQIYASHYDSTVKLNSVKTLAAAKYPICPEYPDYSEPRIDSELQESIYYKHNSNRRSSAKDIDKYSDFYNELISSALTECNDENRVISPVNIYIAASMLAEISDGETQEQILSALDTNSIEELRENAETLWNSNYIYDKTREQILSSSLWLNDDVEFKEPAIKALAEHYYADSFSGDFGDPDLTADMQKWLSKRTGGLLDEQIGDVRLNRDDVMNVLTTVYFSARWVKEFYPGTNTNLIFHSPNGDKEAVFMCESQTGYSRGEGFGAVCKGFKESGFGRMWFILPDENVTVGDVLSQENFIDSVLDDNLEKYPSYIVNIKVPKFDVSSEMTLNSSFKAMGIEDAFDMNKADFSALTDFTPTFVGKIEHNARVIIDEEGCKAAAFTVLPGLGAAGVQDMEIIDFILDKPFIFIIETDVGQPLFVGVVNNV